MKKVILSLTVVALATVVLSCKEDKTPEDYLTIKGGWKISKATSTPAYTNSDGVTDADLAKSWFYECELSDVLEFKSDKDGNRTVLTTTCNTTVKEKETLGTWNFEDTNKDGESVEHGTLLKFRLPFFEEDEKDVVTVETLDDKNFVFSYKWKPDPAGESYTFRVSYVPAK